MEIPTFYADPCFLNHGSHPPTSHNNILLLSCLFPVWKMAECWRWKSTLQFQGQRLSEQELWRPSSLSSIVQRKASTAKKIKAQFKVNWLENEELGSFSCASGTISTSPPLPKLIPTPSMEIHNKLFKEADWEKPVFALWYFSGWKRLHCFALEHCYPWVLQIGIKPWRGIQSIHQVTKGQNWETAHFCALIVTSAIRGGPWS